MTPEIDELNKAIAETAEVTENLQKSHVKGYTRTTASGASVQVKEHNDSRPIKVHHKDLKEGDVLYNAKGDKIDHITGFVRGIKHRGVETRAGYTHYPDANGYLQGVTNKKPKQPKAE